MIEPQVILHFYLFIYFSGHGENIAVVYYLFKCASVSKNWVKTVTEIKSKDYVCGSLKDM